MQLPIDDEVHFVSKNVKNISEKTLTLKKKNRKKNIKIPKKLEVLLTTRNRKTENAFTLSLKPLQSFTHSVIHLFTIIPPSTF
jgi:hypothetical protein